MLFFEIQHFDFKIIVCFLFAEISVCRQGRNLVMYNLGLMPQAFLFSFNEV
jgi:hypothetical protein